MVVTSCHIKVTNNTTCEGWSPESKENKTIVIHWFVMVVTSRHMKITNITTWEGRSPDHIVGWICPWPPSWCRRSHRRQPYYDDDGDGGGNDGSSVKVGNDDTIYRKLFPPRKLPHSFAALKIRTKMPWVKMWRWSQHLLWIRSSLLFHQYVIVFILQRDQLEREVL